MGKNPTVKCSLFPGSSPNSEKSGKLPPESSQPGVTAPIDWASQPQVPAEKIDWSRQGEPLRVRPTLSMMITLITLGVSVLGGGAYFYWGVRTHIEDQRIHLNGEGIGWGASARFETRVEARKARAKVVSTIEKRVDAVEGEVVKLRQDQQASTKKILRALRRHSN